MGESGAGAHVRPRFQNAPEVSLARLERFFSDGPLPGLHAFLVEIPGFFKRAGCFLGEENISVGTVRRDLQRLPRQAHALLSAGFPGLVHHLLSLLQRRLRLEGGYWATGRQALEKNFHLVGRFELLLFEKLGEVAHRLFHGQTIGQSRGLPGAGFVLSLLLFLSASAFLAGHLVPTSFGLLE